VILDDLWEFLKKEVFDVASKPTLFNQYKDVDPKLDLPHANEIRISNLKSYLDSFSNKPSILGVGEAPGPWGCRFSGVPFTSEDQLLYNALPFRGQQSSNRLLPYSEKTATIFWQAIALHHQKIIVWNCVPFHPHQLGDPLSIRGPNISEVNSYSSILRGVLDLIEPRLFVAIGRHAQEALARLHVESIYVPHPARGGANEFRQRMNEILQSFQGARNETHFASSLSP
jgi:uracil-DNA glycosylase